jgi:hypothetical protein
MTGSGGGEGTEGETLEVNTGWCEPSLNNARISTEKKKEKKSNSLNVLFPPSDRNTLQAEVNKCRSNRSPKVKSLPSHKSSAFCFRHHIITFFFFFGDVLASRYNYHYLEVVTNKQTKKHRRGKKDSVIT